MSNDNVQEMLHLNATNYDEYIKKTILKEFLESLLVSYRVTSGRALSSGVQMKGAKPLR